MAKVATKDLSQKASELLKSVSESRKKALGAIDSLKEISGKIAKAEAERIRLEENEARQRTLEAAIKSINETAQQQAIAKAAAEKAKNAPAPEQKVEKAENTPAEKPQAAPVKAEAAENEKKPAEKPQAAPRAQQPQQRAQQPYGRPANSQGQAAAPGQAPRGPYGRPANPQGQSAAPGQAPRGPYGRPANPQGQSGAPGQAPRGPYGRPANPQGQSGAPGQAPRGPYGRPANPQGQAGAAPMGNRAPGGRPPMGGAGAGAPRPAGGFAPRRPAAPDLTPSVEKERVSNYDPNKKQYVRQVDPERNTQKNKRQQTRSAAPSVQMDDEYVRGGKRKRKVAAPVAKPEPVKIEKAVMTAEKITVKDLSERIGKPVSEIIKKLLMLGIFANINNELDFDTAQLICTEFEIELELKLAETAEDALEAEDVEDKEEDLVHRPPVVTIMGHVDHGKTSLLDYIRKTRVTAGEAGGITQHIGAYTVDLHGEKITFLDTPGHEAFTAMRARGAQATDIAILVVAADDGVMPQTIEAINHAKAAGVQTIVAINKMDKPTADPDRIRQELTKYELIDEEWGGDTIIVPVSAHTGQGVDQLLEMILLVAEVQDYKANPNRKARGVIVEARLDKGRGPVANVLIKNGTLNVGDTIIAGTAYGRVRAMVNDRGERVKQAFPSDPVEVIGFNDVPEAGDILSAVDDDSLSRKVAEERKDKAKAALIKAQSKTTLDDLFNQISEGQLKELNIIIKADVQGSVEAVKQSLERLSNNEVKVRAIHGGVGAITETDVLLASASNAIIIGFNVRHDNSVRDVADREKVDIRLYRVIYNAIEDIEAAMKGMLAPKFKENVLGRCRVRQTFKVSGVGTVAGCYVTDGKIQRNASVRLLRDNVVIHEGKIDSLKRFKDDVKEVATGYECGLGIEGYNDVKENDEIECFIMEEVQR
ncbi:MAG: translation initiation factor IF-2 [Clostridiales bacterium]|nr:translation initiation factor IF-2 [Clostridiales bacterium]